MASNRVSGKKFWISKIRDRRLGREIGPKGAQTQELAQQRLTCLLLTGRNVVVFLNSRHLTERPHWLAEDAVQIEPVSREQFPLTGKIIGNLLKKPFGFRKTAVIAPLA
jgi:hypothetical protein